MIYWEDLRVGEVYETGPRTVTREEILSFAREYDPQPFHLDEEAAGRSIFGGLIASGWQTACIVHRMLFDGFIKDAASLGSPGVDHLRWTAPVRPGDSLTVRFEIIELKPSNTHPDRGFVRSRYEVRNQRSQQVMTIEGPWMMARRPAS